jgi:hypothetical protein
VATVAVDNRFGKVVVEAAADGYGWTWDLKCWASTQADAERLADVIALEVVEDGGGGRWTLKLPEPPVPELRGVESELTLRVPASAAVDVRHGFGTARVHGLGGRVELDCEHAEVALEDLGGALDAETSFGALRAQRIAGGKLRNKHGAIIAAGVAGALDAETSFGPLEASEVGGELRASNEHGSIKATGVKGRVEARTSFGRLDVEGDSPEVVCHNQHGAIALRLASGALRSVEARTSFAGIEVSVPAGAEARIEAETSFGKVESDLHPGSVAQDGLTSRLRDGPAGAPLRLQLRSEHGDIRITGEKSTREL